MDDRMNCEGIQYMRELGLGMEYMIMGLSFLVEKGFFLASSGFFMQEQDMACGDG